MIITRGLLCDLENGTKYCSLGPYLKVNTQMLKRSNINPKERKIIEESNFRLDNK